MAAHRKNLRVFTDRTFAAKAIQVHACRGCGLWHEGKKPAACLACGRMDFDDYDSKGEAKMYARLQQMQHAKMISDLERQVRVPLLTVHQRTGKPVHFADYIADFRYREPAGTGDLVLAEYKPKAGMTYESSLKLRCCEAAGISVTILTS